MFIGLCKNCSKITSEAERIFKENYPKRLIKLKPEFIKVGKQRIEISEDYFFHKKDKEKKYKIEKNEIIEKIIENNYDSEKSYNEIAEIIEYKLNIDLFKEKDRKRKIREKAEEDFYGRIKNKREHISSEKRDSILEKFNNQCIVCGKKEGLHIHHKDNNPQNNNIENLVVLCGICHKKTHMNVR